MVAVPLAAEVLTVKFGALAPSASLTLRAPLIPLSSTPKPEVLPLKIAASFTAVISIMALSEPVFVSPLPVLPRSLAARVRIVLAGGASVLAV